MTTTHPSLARDEALHFAELAEAAQYEIDDLNTNGGNNAARIARTCQHRDLFASLAQVHALLAVAEAMAVD